MKTKTKYYSSVFSAILCAIIGLVAITFLSLPINIILCGISILFGVCTFLFFAERYKQILLIENNVRSADFELKIQLINNQARKEIAHVSLLLDKPYAKKEYIRIARTMIPNYEYGDENEL